MYLAIDRYRQASIILLSLFILSIENGLYSISRAGVIKAADKTANFISLGYTYESIWSNSKLECYHLWIRMLVTERSRRVKKNEESEWRKNFLWLEFASRGTSRKEGI